MHLVIAVSSNESSAYAFDWCLEKGIIPPAGVRMDEKNPLLVTLVSVVEPPVEAHYYYAAAGSAVFSESAFEGIRARANNASMELLQEYMQKLRSHNPDVPVETTIGHGDVRDEIVDLAQSSRADLVVVGSRGLGALKRAFIGSTSDYVVHHCSCPVLVVRKA